ncbi:MAG TPA: MFS transporter [Ktedonobacteraceae bacterium]|nr:MFS transporter [Ktedonobacteraceae bacterium]
MSTPTVSKWLTLIAACLGLTMLYIDLFIVNVALPSLEHELHTSLSTVSWTISAYALMIGVFPMGMGRLADLWGQRKLYFAGLVIFTLASLACGFAHDILSLIVFRVIQGIGAAIMTPGTLAIVVRAFPLRQRGLAVGIYGGISGLGLIAGPALGGLLVQSAGWRWVFFINVPIGLIALAMTMLFVPESRDEQASPHVDWVGLGLLCAGLLCVMFACTQAGTAGWTSFSVVGSGVIGIICLTIFVAVERRVRAPLVDLSLFRSRAFTLGNASFFLFSAALFGLQPYMSLFMQNYWGFSPLQGGLAFLPATGLIAALTPVAGIIGQRAGSRLRIVGAIGLLAMGLSSLYVAWTVGLQGSYTSSFLPALLARGVGIPLITTSATLAVMGAVSAGKSGLAAGTLGMTRNIGTALGVAVFGQVFLGQVGDLLAGNLGFLSTNQAALVRIAAGQFLVRGSGASQHIAGQAIVQGFATIMLVAAILCGLAFVVVCCMRTSASKDAEQHHDEVDRRELLQHGELNQTLASRALPGMTEL